MIGPMLAQEADTIPTGDEWVMERKHDGWRFMFVMKGGGVKAYAGRNSSDRTGQARLVEDALRNLHLPSGTILDGELIAVGEGLGSSDVSTILAAPRAGRLQFVVFDVLTIGTHDIRQRPWRERRAYIEAMQAGLDDFPRFDGYHVVASEVHPASQDLHDRWVREGAEGSVAKDRNASYVSGRSWGFVKVKAIATAEAVITGFEVGKGQSNGDRYAAFTIRMIETGADSSCTIRGNDLQYEVSANPEKWLNKVIEVKHYGMMASGKPKSPIYLRLREDRDASELSQSPTKEAKIKVPSTRVHKPTRRAYGQMKEPKLLRVIEELRTGGEAYTRAVNKGFDPAEDLAIAEAVLEDLRRERAAA